MRKAENKSNRAFDEILKRLCPPGRDDGAVVQDGKTKRYRPRGENDRRTHAPF